jgi:ribosomal protein L7/L12
MDANTRERRRRETAVRLMASHADIATSLLGRAPRIAATSMRGGVLALLVKLRTGPRTDGELESLHRIVASLARLKGAAMKLGQHMSYFDPTLPDEVRTALAALQTHSPAMSVSRVTKILRTELGAAGARIVETLEATPVSSASIGQVHRARLPDGTHVAVKVQYPGIASAIKADFGPASLAGSVATWLYPTSRVKTFLKEAKARALAECDYRAEARHQASFAARYAEHPAIAIPAVHGAYCTDRVLVTTFCDGIALGEWLATDPPQPQRDAIGAALVAFYAGSALRFGVLPGDPHPGNYLVMGAGRLAIVDHGCTREVTPAQAELVLDADDEQAARRGAAGLGADALLLLRVRIGVGSVLAQLGVKRTWRELVDEALRWSPPSMRVPAPPSRATPPAPVPTRFEVVLVAPGERTIEIVREVRDLMGANIRDAKELVDRAPCVLRTTSDRGEAEAVKRRLETSGGIVEIRAS